MLALHLATLVNLLRVIILFFHSSNKILLSINYPDFRFFFFLNSFTSRLLKNYSKQAVEQYLEETCQESLLCSSSLRMPFNYFLQNTYSCLVITYLLHNISKVKVDECRALHTFYPWSTKQVILFPFGQNVKSFSQIIKVMERSP